MRRCAVHLCQSAKVACIEGLRLSTQPVSCISRLRSVNCQEVIEVEDQEETSRRKRVNKAGCTVS